MKKIEKMDMLKKCILLMGVAILVMLLAFLPKIAALLQDEMSLGKVKFAKMQSVELDIHDSLPAMGKLSLLKDVGNCIELSKEQASMSEEEVSAAVEAEVSKYVNAGLISSEYEFDFYSCRPMILMDMENPQITWTFWDCVLDSEQGGNLVLMIDDETGTCYLSAFHGNQVLKVKQENFLEIWIDLYFSALEISEYAMFEQDYTDRYVGENGWARCYSFGDRTYGEVSVVFYVYKYGFYMEFPKSLNHVNESSTGKK